MTVLHRGQIDLRLAKRIEDFERGYRQNVALLGRPAAGKTRVLAGLFNSVQSRPSLLPVLIPLADVTEPHIVTHWVRSLLAAGLNLPAYSVDSLLEAGEASLPKTCKAARHVLKLNKQGNGLLAVRELFALAGQLAEESRRKVVCLLDEVLGIEKLPAPDVYSIFGNRMMMEKEVLFIVTSSDPRRAREIFSDKLALLFSNFEILPVQPLGFFEMCGLISQRACGSYLSVPARRFLFRLTDGEPSHLDALLRVLDESVCADPKRPLGAAALFEAVMREVLEKDGRIALDFQKRIGGFKRPVRERESLAAEAASVLGAGKTKPAMLAQALGIKLPECRKLLTRMEEEDWVTNGGSASALRDPLFRLWAAEFLAPACMGLDSDMRVIRSRWTKKLGQIYESCLESDAARLAPRIEALCRMFRNEMVVLDGRRVRSAVLHEISYSSPTDSCWLIRALAAKENYFYLASLREIHEQDVESFLSTTVVRRKIARRVIVAAAGIDQNARLLAQQNKIEIWDLRFLNIVLDFFGLPKVIAEMRQPVWAGTAAGGQAESLFSLVRD